jgi:hypothetical protein
MNRRPRFRTPSRFQYSLAALLCLTAVIALAAALIRYTAFSHATLFLVGTHLGIAAAGSLIFTQIIDRDGC